MKLFTRRKHQGKRWNRRPESQDLRQMLSTGGWVTRTACCQSKKGWKRAFPVLLTLFRIV